MPNTLHMNTEQARALAEQIREAGQTMTARVNTMLHLTQDSSIWSGTVADHFRGDSRAALRRLLDLAEQQETLALSLRTEIEQWEQVDTDGQEHFRSCIQNSIDQQEKNRIEELLFTGDYEHGETYIIDTGDYDPFHIPPQFFQKGGNCVLYGLLHLALMHGKNLTREEIDALLAKYRPWWLPGFLGIPTFWMDDILRDLGLDFDQEGFNFFQSQESDIRSGAEGWTYDISSMQDRLIDHLRNGEPVYVTSDCEIFGYANGAGGHAYNVIGANVDAQGNLISVVVDTNWGDPSLMTIDGNAFLHDWAQSGCQMITIRS